MIAAVELAACGLLTAYLGNIVGAAGLGLAAVVTALWVREMDARIRAERCCCGGVIDARLELPRALLMRDDGARKRIEQRRLLAGTLIGTNNRRWGMRKIKRLTLNRETVRQLSTADLGEAYGGAIDTWTNPVTAACPSKDPQPRCPFPDPPGN